MASSKSMQIQRPHRQQAGSYRDGVQPEQMRNPVGARLAREGALKPYAKSKGPIASKPAPTGSAFNLNKCKTL